MWGGTCVGRRKERERWGSGRGGAVEEWTLSFPPVSASGSLCAIGQVLCGLGTACRVAGVPSPSLWFAEPLGPGTDSLFNTFDKGLALLSSRAVSTPFPSLYLPCLSHSHSGHLRLLQRVGLVIPQEGRGPQIRRH